MTLWASFRKTYRLSLLSSLVTLPLFVPLILWGIDPYRPAGVAGWVIIVAYIIDMEVIGMALWDWLHGLPTDEPSPPGKMMKVIGWSVPVVIGVTIVVTNMLDYVRSTFFVIG